MSVDTSCGGRIRLNVRWGRKGRSSAATPAASAAVSTRDASEVSSADPSWRPIQSTVAFFARGNAPRPAHRTPKRPPRSAWSRAPASRSVSTDPTSPMNRRVKCQFAGSTRRPGIAKPTSVAANAWRTSVVRAAVTNNRLSATTPRRGRAAACAMPPSWRRSAPALCHPEVSTSWPSRRRVCGPQ